MSLCYTRKCCLKPFVCLISPRQSQSTCSKCPKALHSLFVYLLSAENMHQQKLKPCTWNPAARQSSLGKKNTTHKAVLFEFPCEPSVVLFMQFSLRRHTSVPPTNSLHSKMLTLGRNTNLQAVAFLELQAFSCRLCVDDSSRHFLLYVVFKTSKLSHQPVDRFLLRVQLFFKYKSTVRFVLSDLLFCVTFRGSKNAMHQILRFKLCAQSHANKNDAFHQSNMLGLFKKCHF